MRLLHTKSGWLLFFFKMAAYYLVEKTQAITVCAVLCVSNNIIIPYFSWKRWTLVLVIEITIGYSNFISLFNYFAFLSFL